jgi:hypothetical protein
VSRVDEWWSDQPRQAPAEYTTRLARKRVWRDVERSFIATVPDLEDVSFLLQADVELAHALVFVLSRLPKVEAREFADHFYERRTGCFRTATHLSTGSRAAAVALMVLPLTQRADLANDRIADLLTAIQQSDDLSLTPPAAVEEVQRAVARARLDLDLEDQLDPRAAATTAVIEVLDPSSGMPALQEIVMRATWATLQTTGIAGVLEFLLDVDALSAE